MSKDVWTNPTNAKANIKSPSAIDEGFGVVARRCYGDVLKSFHGTALQAEMAAKEVIELDPLMVSPVEVCFAANENIRLWRKKQNTTVKNNIDPEYGRGYDPVPDQDAHVAHFC